MTAEVGPATEGTTRLTYGIRENLGQFLHQLLQVLLVGFALGMMRTVVPALAEVKSVWPAAPVAGGWYCSRDMVVVSW